MMPAVGEVALRLRAKVMGIPVDEATVARGEKALPDPLRVLEAELRKDRWMLGSDFSLVDCAYCPILNVIDKAGFSCDRKNNHWNASARPAAVAGHNRPVVSPR